MGPYDLASRPIHLGLGATAEVEPSFTNEMAWYEAYLARHSNDGVEGRLVSLYSFKDSWDAWEMHPEGSEVVVCIEGQLTLRQEEHSDGSTASVTLAPGQYAINPPGTWHTADVKTEATALSITAGLGTQHRPR